MKKLTNKVLQSMLKKTDNNLEKAVINHVLEYSDDAQERQYFVNDLQSHGCVSGVVSGLIHYHDTNEFYNKLKDEIWELLYNDCEDLGNNSIPEFIGTLNGAKDVNNHEQFCNLLAWYGFEQTCYKLFETE